MIILRESAGDIKLCKFVCILTSMIKGISQNYYEEFGGYIYLEEYTYNTISNAWPDDYIYHDWIENRIPREIYNEVVDENGDSLAEFVFGAVDYKPNHTFMYVDRGILSKDQEKFLEKFLKRYLQK